MPTSAETTVLTAVAEAFAEADQSACPGVGMGEEEVAWFGGWALVLRRHRWLPRDAA